VLKACESEVVNQLFGAAAEQCGNICTGDSWEVGKVGERDAD